MNCENFFFSWYENHNFFNPIFRNALHLLLDDHDGLCGSLHSSEKLGSDSLKGRHPVYTTLVHACSFEFCLLPTFLRVQGFEDMITFL